MKLLFLGDSLLFGRSSHHVLDRDTWPFVLSQQLNATPLIRGYGGSRVFDVIKEAELLRTYWYGDNYESQKPIVFVQVGTVDVAPRLLPRALHFKAKLIPGYHNLLRYPAAYRLIGYQWTSLDQFDRALIKLNKVLSVYSEHVFYIEIPRPSNYLLQNTGDYSVLVERYNRILLKNSRPNHFVAWDIGDNLSDLVLPDGHHLNHNGHRHIASCAANCIRQAVLTTAPHSLKFTPP